MKVKELIAMLQAEDGERIVVLPSHGEYSPLSSLSIGAYGAETTWYGRFGLERLTDEDRKRGYCDEDVVEGVPALVLYPIN